MKRRLIQLCMALLHNLNLRGSAETFIYEGRSKRLCAPGLNCRSYPGIVGSRPLGILRNALSTMDRKLPFYISRVLLLFGATTGGTICGLLYPFDLVQEPLYRIPVPKIKKNRVTRKLPKVKYVVLAVFVIILSVVFKTASDLPVSVFCKYTCPAGTLEGGIPLVLLDGSLSGLTGVLFHWRVLVLVVVLISTCFPYRSLYRILCPLRVIYSLFAPMALLGARIDRDICIDCGRCMRIYKMDARQVRDRECIQCGECMRECNVDAIYWKKPWGVKDKR